MWVYHDHRLRPKANRNSFPSGSVIFSAVHFMVNVFQRFINAFKTLTWSAAVRWMQNILRTRRLLWRHTLLCFYQFSLENPITGGTNVDKHVSEGSAVAQEAEWSPTNQKVGGWLAAVRMSACPWAKDRTPNRTRCVNVHEWMNAALCCKALWVVGKMRKAPYKCSPFTMKDVWASKRTNCTSWYYFSLHTSGKMKLKSSWGTDDICLTFAIYYLIIHHMFSVGEKKAGWYRSKS